MHPYYVAGGAEAHIRERSTGRIVATGTRPDMLRLCAVANACDGIETKDLEGCFTRRAEAWDTPEGKGCFARH